MWQHKTIICSLKQSSAVTTVTVTHCCVLATWITASVRACVILQTALCLGICEKKKKSNHFIRPLHFVLAPVGETHKVIK